MLLQVLHVQILGTRQEAIFRIAKLYAIEADVRGQPADFDSWAQRGNRGWGYVDMLPYYKRTERRIGIADDRIHGREGKLPVTDIDWIHPICVKPAIVAGNSRIDEAKISGITPAELILSGRCVLCPL